MSRIFYSIVVACVGLAVVKADDKKSYEVKLNGIKMDKTGKTVFGDSNITMHMMDDNNAVVSGTFELRRDLFEDAKVYIQGYKAKGDGTGMYDSESSCDYDSTLGDFYVSDDYVMPDLLKCSNLPSEVPVKKGYYTFVNCVIGRSWPQDLPGKDWKMVAHAEMVDADNNKLKSTVEVEVTLDKTPKAPK